jgi:molybdopterin-guanine dinucleotide biosynthesis protein A
VLGRLLDPLGSSDVAVLDDGAGPRPLPMAIRPSAVKPKVDRLLADGERRLRALLAEVSYVALAPLDWRRDDPGGETLLDVDRPEDLPR